MVMRSEKKVSTENESKEVRIEELNQEIVKLRAQLFKTRNELHSIRNSRLIGRIVKARESVGSLKNGARHAPRKIVVKTKHSISNITPEFIKPPIRLVVVRPVKKIIHINDKRLHKKAATYQSAITSIPNKEWFGDKTLVSVVVPYYNRADTIDDTIASLQKQTFKNFEVIIVNDGSTDQDSITKLKDLKKKNPTYVFLDQKNQGVAAARNNGIKKATGKYIICLDSDDMIEPTYIEKCSILLERNLDISLVTTYRKDFGVLNEETRTVPYDPVEIYNNNMVITAAQFKKEAWLASGGYKSGIGYEDWEYWLTLAEHGHWGKLLPELLFVYRVAMVSRFVQDKEAHWNNVKLIQNMHKQYNKKIEKIASKRRAARLVATNDTTLINLSNPKDYLQPEKSKKNVLVTIPWMTFGGAETLIYNYCREIKDDFSITFVTGLESKHEWEYKFREITPNIYHLTNLFDDTSMYIEFLSNYIKTRGVDILHIIHNGFTFEMLPELKKRHPKLKVIVTMFNDRVEHFNKSLEYAKYIDVFTSDNGRVINHYKNMLGDGIETVVIPNGIDCYTTFKLGLFERDKERKNLGIEDGEIAVFFVGRLSEEKNPNVFVDAAKDILKTRKKLGIKFFVVGDGGMKQQIEEMIKAVDSSSIKYLGYQSDVAKYLSAADVFVLPSSIEGFPLSILEAMAMKVAVVASDVGAVAEVIENKVDGFVVTPGDSQEISDAIIILEKDRDLLEDMKIRSRKKVEKNYSNKILGKHYTELYKGTK